MNASLCPQQQVTLGLAGPTFPGLSGPGSHLVSVGGFVSAHLSSGSLSLSRTLPPFYFFLLSALSLSVPPVSLTTSLSPHVFLASLFLSLFLPFLPRSLRSLSFSLTLAPVGEGAEARWGQAGSGALPLPPPPPGIRKVGLSALPGVGACDFICLWI